MRTPAEVYQRSEIEYAGTPEELEYPITFMKRKINKNGYVKLNKTSIPVSSSLRGMTVELQLYNEYMLWLADFPLGIVSTETYCFSALGKLE